MSRFWRQSNTCWMSEKFPWPSCPSIWTSLICARLEIIEASLSRRFVSWRFVRIAAEGSDKSILRSFLYSLCKNCLIHSWKGSHTLNQSVLGLLGGFACNWGTNNAADNKYNDEGPWWKHEANWFLLHANFLCWQYIRKLQSLFQFLGTVSSCAAQPPPPRVVARRAM